MKNNLFYYFAVDNRYFIFITVILDSCKNMKNKIIWKMLEVLCFDYTEDYKFTKHLFAI